MARKTRSDTVSGKLAAAQAPDLTARTAPQDVTGYSELTPYGITVYQALYRSRAEWNYSDLALIVQAGQVAQTIRSLNKSISPPDCLIIENPRTGIIKAHPAIAIIGQQRTLFANLLRAASLRLKDAQNRHNFAPHAQPHVASPLTNAPPVETFESWMEEQLLNTDKPN
ncbi:hypothetical protein AB9F26_05960 [Falsihalocynthiibacter sp. BN13B15]|uniref:hypothetical protein n=1 Tax=Falsihalocynthiibacter sp. BN13B15 TaxID=3240871 RepID=UPI00350EC8D1